MSMNISFIVTRTDIISQAKAIAELGNVKCRVEIDFKKNLVKIELANPAEIDEVVDIINNSFEIERTIINNTDMTEDIVSNQKKETENTAFTENYFRKFDDELGEAVDRIHKTIYWAIKNDSFDENKKKQNIYYIERILKAAKDEIRLVAHDRTDMIEKLSIGDIVEVFYGWSLKGESAGEKVYSVILKMEDDVVDVIPLVRIEKDDDNKEILKVFDDFTYNDGKEEYFKILKVERNYRRTLNKKRILARIGKCTPQGIAKVMIESSVKTITVKASEEKVVENIETKEKNSSTISLIRHYLEEKNKKSFEVDEIYKNFPTINKSTLSGTIFRMKQGGEISSTKKKGHYKVIGLKEV